MKYQLFDTSDNYCNEEYLGQAIREDCNVGDDVVIHT